MVQRELQEDVIESRLKWKKLFRQVADRGHHRTAEQIANTANTILIEWGKPQRLSSQYVNLFRSIPKKIEESKKVDLRVPQNEETANAIVWALEELGSWIKVAFNDKKKEQSDLINLLLSGFEILDRPVPSQWTGDVRGRAEELLEELKPESTVLFDNPQDGPLSAKDPEVLALIYRIVVENESTIHIYANEKPDTELAETLNSVTLLFLTVAIALKNFSKGPEDTIAYLKFLSNKEIRSACQKAISIRNKTYAEIETWLVPKNVFDILNQKIVIFGPNSERWPAQQRYNPLTLILIRQRSSNGKEQPVKALIVYGLEEIRWEDPITLSKYFDERRNLRMVNQVQISPEIITNHAKGMDFFLEIK